MKELSHEAIDALEHWAKGYNEKLEEKRRHKAWEAMHLYLKKSLIGKHELPDWRTNFFRTSTLKGPVPSPGRTGKRKRGSQ